MTAITTVPSHLRLARVTPYLLAAAAALAAWLLLGAHTAFAAEKAGSAHSRPHAAEAVEPAPRTHRGDPAATERAVQKPVDRRVAQASEPGDDHRSGGRKTLYHPAADAGKPISLCTDDHAFHDRRRAGGGRAGASLDLDEAQPAGAEGFQ